MRLLLSVLGRRDTLCQILFFCIGILHPLFVFTQQPANQYETIELSFESNLTYSNPYIDVDVKIRFTNDSNDTLWRPAFWDGINEWKVRFSSPTKNDTWSWTSYCSDTTNRSLHGQVGTIHTADSASSSLLAANGTLKMSPGKRNLVFASGKSFLMVANTLWASPFRATTMQIEQAATRLEQ